MRLKTAFLSLSLSLVCLLPTVTRAATLTLTGVGGASSDGVYTYPYLFTVTGPGGTSTDVLMSCLNFNRDVYTNETWSVTEVAVSSIGAAGLDGESQKAFLEDAYLYNLYTGADAQQTQDIQFAIWAIMDPSVATSHLNGYDAEAARLDRQALAAYNSGNFSFDANDSVFIPVAGGYPTQDGEPQIFMVDPPPPSMTPTPEPSSLLLLGTGFFGAVGILRRRAMKA